MTDQFLNLLFSCICLPSRWFEINIRFISSHLTKTETVTNTTFIFYSDISICKVEKDAAFQVIMDKKGEYGKNKTFFSQNKMRNDFDL